MNELVLDASVVLPWFSEPPVGVDGALEAERRFRRGEFRAVVPEVMFLEILNVAGRQWRWSEERLGALAGLLARSRFELGAVPLPELARWIAKGLTAYDATYVALAETRGSELLTYDGEILARAPGIARSP